jgi:hypothetical protein
MQGTTFCIRTEIGNCFTPPSIYTFGDTLQGFCYVCIFKIPHRDVPPADKGTNGLITEDAFRFSPDIKELERMLSAYKGIN